MKFYTSDWHLNSPGIIEYARRPWKTATAMNAGIIRNANQRAHNKTDVIFHVGDFCSMGNDQGFKSLDISPKDHVKAIKATLILLEGNHDCTNRVSPVMSHCYTNLGRWYLNVSVGHYPSNNEMAKGQFQPNSIRLCGHVHNAWKYYYDELNNVLNINVGLDVWRQQIVPEQELIVYIQQLERKLNKNWRSNEPKAIFSSNGKTVQNKPLFTIHVGKVPSRTIKKNHPKDSRKRNDIHIRLEEFQNRPNISRREQHVHSDQ